MTGVLFACGGAAAGAAHAALLARSARGRPGALLVPLRLLIVAGVLLLAARAGYLAFGAVGWGAGLVGTSLLVLRRLP